jgi:hypothetical protein
MAPTLQTRLANWERELQQLHIIDRWGETRRFHSNARKIARRAWLISHISDARVKLGLVRL